MVSNIRAMQKLSANALKITSVLCCQTPPSTQFELFRFKSRLFVSHSRLKRMHDTPWLALLHIIAEQLEVPTSILDICLEITKKPPEKLMPFNTIFSPSKPLMTSLIHRCQFFLRPGPNFTLETKIQAHLH